MERLRSPGACLNIKNVFPGYTDSIRRMRRLWDRLIFVIGISILVRRHFYIERDPWSPYCWCITALCMETIPALLALCKGNSPVTKPFVLSLLLACANCWINRWQWIYMAWHSCDVTMVDFPFIVQIQWKWNIRLSACRWHLIPGHGNAINLFAYHDSTGIMACAKFYSDC